MSEVWKNYENIMAKKLYPERYGIQKQAAPQPPKIEPSIEDKAVSALYKIANDMHIHSKKKEDFMLRSLANKESHGLSQIATIEEINSLCSDVHKVISESRPDIKEAVEHIFDTTLEKMGITDQSYKNLYDIDRWSDIKNENKGDVTKYMEYPAKSDPTTIEYLRESTTKNEEEPTRVLMYKKMLKGKDAHNPYDGIEKIYKGFKPGTKVNDSKKYKMTQEGHKKTKFNMVAPSYNNNGAVFRGDVRNEIATSVARRNPTGLGTHYTGAVPLGFEELNTIGDIAHKLRFKGEEELATLAENILKTAIKHNVKATYGD